MGRGGVCRLLLKIQRLRDDEEHVHLYLASVASCDLLFEVETRDQEYRKGVVRVTNGTCCAPLELVACDVWTLLLPLGSGAGCFNMR